MEIAMILVWMLRVVLPIVLFWIYFKLQLPKEGEELQGSTKHCHSRSKLLDYSAVGRGAPAPEEVANIVMVDEARAPMLFAAGPPGRSARGRASGRERGGGAPREPHGERGQRGGSRPVDAANEGGAAPAASTRRGLEAPAPAEPPTLAPPSASPPGPEEEKLQQLESLLNYVAFNRKEQQRTFLVDESSAPPPPPPPKRATPQPPPPVAPKKSALAGAKELGEPLSADAEHANKEAQMILKGAMDFKRSDVANDLYAKLTDSQVEISCTTFTLMIESCILASDLKTASDLLMRMEASGHCPEATLLDKVMALYSKHKQQGGAPLAPARTAAPTRTNLSSSAEMFQPSGILAAEDALLVDVLGGATSAEERARLSVDAPAFIPLSAGAALGAPPPPPPAQRTALCASADPFMPKGLVSFDADKHIWTVENGKNDTHGMGERPGKGDERGKGDRRTGKGKSSKAEGKLGKGGDQPKATSADISTKAKVRAEAAKARGETKDGKASPAKKETKGAKTWKAKDPAASAE